MAAGSDCGPPAPTSDSGPARRGTHHTAHELVLPLRSRGHVAPRPAARHQSRRSITAGEVNR